MYCQLSNAHNCQVVEEDSYMVEKVSEYIGSYSYILRLIIIINNLVAWADKLS